MSHMPQVGAVIKFDSKSRVVMTSPSSSPRDLSVPKPLISKWWGMYVVTDIGVQAAGPYEFSLRKLSADGKYDPKAPLRKWWLPRVASKTHIFEFLGHIKQEVVFTQFVAPNLADALPKAVLKALTVFGDAAQTHGIMQEYGSGSSVGEALRAYDESRNQLIKEILALSKDKEQ